MTADLVGAANAEDRPWRARTPKLFVLACVLLAVLPIIVAVARAVASGWIPSGDDAVFAIRARDVFSAHPPLLGTWTSASISTRLDVNNPGPLYYDLIAVPVRVFGGNAGTAIGAGLVNCLAVVGIALVAFRRGGPLVVAAAMAVTAALAWSMGSAALYGPTQPVALVLPFLCYLALAWSVAAGDLVTLPWLLGVGSIVVQTHVVYAFLVPLLAVVALVGLGLVLRRCRSLDGGRSRHASRRRVAGAAGASLLVLVLAWVQPVVEQWTSNGPGNLTRLWRGAGQTSANFGLHDGTRIAGEVLALPPWWLRPSFRDAFLPARIVAAIPGTVPAARARLPSLPTAATAIGILVALLAMCAWYGHRRRDRAVTSLAIVAGVAVALGVWNANRIPVGPFGLSQHVFRWLWPIGAFAVLALVVTVVRSWSQRPGRRLVALASMTCATAVFAGLAIPASVQTAAAPGWPVDFTPVARDLDHQIAVLKHGGPYLFDPTGLPFGDFSAGAIMSGLQARGIPFVLSSPGWLRQLGRARRFDGTNARAVVTVRLGDDALVPPPPGLRRVALHKGLTRSERRTLDRLEAVTGAYLRAHPVLRLDARGRHALHRDTVDGLDPDNALAVGRLDALVQQGYLALPRPWTSRFERAATLRARWFRSTVGVFVAPLNPPAPSHARTAQPVRPG